MNLSKRTLSVILLLCALVALFALAAIAVFADGAGEGATDAMEAIESEFSAEKIGETQLIGDDGYIGIPVELSIYYDKSKGAIRSGYNGTPIIVYVVNTKAVRVGTDDDTDIIRSMLDRGYAVVILDYLNNGKAVSPALDWSVQGLRIKIRDKAYFSDSIFPSGVYYDNYVVPAGCDISLNNVFFEADKHGADGTLEKIVENWNNDFRGTKGERLVKWVRPDGSRKVTLDKASDGTSVTWYTESGKVDAGGEYTKVKYTVAETITDCVNPDGTPIDLNQYIHIVYPTNPAKPVPVMTIANSAGYLASSVQSADRPQMNGFLFNGYAGAMFDYLYVPMARDDSYGYYDGNPKNVAGAISGDQITYSVHVYNNGKVDTAAMRYIRYLALSDPDTYSFDIEHFGVYGNSKAGWMNLLGEARLQVGLVSDPERYATVDELEEAINDAITAIIDHRALDNHHGETRYDNGITESYTKDGVTIDGGERQPWLTYNGKEIISGVQLDYPSNGPMMIYFNEGHCATFEAAHLYDGGYGAANNYVNAARNMDIPCLFFEVPLGHTFTYGADVNYGVDTYSALFDFAAYHLKGEATRVMHTDYRSGAVIDIDAPIKVMFTGQVSQEEIAKITLTDSENNVIDGSWSSAFGGLEWTFHPNGMKGSTAYTLTVPKGLCGENGVPTKSEYTASFYTYYGEEASISSLAGEAGDYIYFTAPNLPSGANGFTVRFRVTENAANVAQLYALTGFDAANASAATVGELIGSVNLKGAGYYEIDVTEYVAQRAGEEVAFLLRGAKSAGESEIYSTDFSASFGVCKKGADATVTLGTAPDGTNALKAVMNDTGEKYINHTFYTNPTSAITLTNPFGLNITEADYGRAFTVKTRIYDTVSRTVMFNMNYNTSASRQILDYQYVMFNCTTRAGEWTDVEFTYVVYDTDYGKTGPKTKNIGISVENTGDLEKEIYFADFTVTETVTDVNADSFTLMARNDGGIDYSAPVSDKPFAIYSGTQMLAEYSGWAQALSAYRAGERIVLRSNYTFTDSDIYSGFSAGESFDIDLGGYKIICKNTKNSLIWIKNTSANDTVINISGGEIKLKDTALISYESSTAAGAGKSVSVVLSDVTVCAADNAMMKEVISASTVTSGVTTYASVTLNDCDIVLDDEKMSKEPRILFPDGAGDLTVSYKVNGGRISITSQRRFTTHENCKSVEYGKGKDGEYTAVTMHSYAEVDETVAFLRGDTVASLVAASTENNITTYAIAETELSTRYGMIPKQYADETDYPFVVFDGGGNFLGATAIYSRDGGGGALNFINSNTADEWYVLLRRNYIYNESVFNNVSFINGSVTVDLGGFTFSCQQSGGAWLDSHAKRPGVLNYTVKNGTVEVGTMPLIRFSAAASGTAYDGSEPKTFNYVFDGIKFTNIKAATLGKGGYPSVLVNANVTMRNCELDLTEVPTDFVMFTIPETAENLCSDIRIEGGAFISSDDLSGIKINTALNSLSSVKATKNSDGEYSKAILPAGAPAPTVNISSDEGNMCFKLTSTDGVRDTYTMIKNPLETKYGVIPSEYADVDAYPFVLFDENGNCLGATASLMGHSGDTNPATAIAIKYLVDKNVFDYDKQEYVGAVSTVNILLRRDYTYAEGEVMDNLAFTQGTVTIDLNDFTLYQSKYELFRSCAKGCSWSGDSKIFHTTFILKNGNIVLKNNHFAVLSAWDNTGDGKVVKKDWTYSFEDVNFSFAEGATAKALFGFDANAKIGSTFFLNFEGCTFDFDKVAPTAGFTLFSSSSNLIKAVYTVEGGEILASSMNNITVASLNSNGTLLALRDADGKYLMLKTSGVAPTVEFDTADECKAVFAATDTAGEYVLTSYEHSYDNACDAECNVCGKERTAPHTPGEDDGSCLTEVLCSACGATAIPARDAHTPGEDDGNCMTAIGCTECDSIAVPAKSAHSFGDVDWDKVSEAACQEAGCNVVSTKYGVIPSEYADVDAYPFVLFDENGNCLGATASLMGHSGDTNPATAIAIKYLVDKNVFDYDKQEYVGAVSTVNILLRRDYTYAEGEVMDNLAFTQGTVTIDLGGFTLYQSKYELFRSCAKGCSWSGDSPFFHTTFILKNGNIVLKNNHFAVLSSWDNTGDGKVVKKDWTYSFEDVNFSFAAGATAKALFDFDANAKIGSTFFLNFEGCTFDFDKVAPTSGFTLFSSSSSLIKAVYTVEGSEILASSMDNITVASLNSNGTLRALRDADGKYLMLKTNGTVPSVAFDTKDEGKAFFRATANAGEYVLTPCTHTYDNGCDTSCNDCGAEREATHDYSVTDKGGEQHWKICSVCGAVDESTKENHQHGDFGYCTVCEVTFTYAQLKVGKNLSVIYTVDLFDSTILTEGTTLAVKFYKAGKELGVFAPDSAEDGRYTFTLTGIAPQEMTDILDATLVSVDGEGNVIAELAAFNGYTVKDNLDYLLEAYATDEKLVQLVKDIIAYGGAAQEFTGHNKDNLVSEGNTGASTKTPDKTDKTYTDIIDAGNYFTSANVFFDTENKIIVKFMATSGTKLVVKVGDTVIATASAVAGVNEWSTEGIAATELDKVFTFELQNAEGTTLQTITYSINSYCYSMKDSTNDAMRALAIALYNYGVSSKAYVG